MGGDAPRYLSGSDVELGASGFVFRDRASGGVVTYAPGLARLDDGVLTWFRTSDLVLVDGTFWRDDELPDSASRPAARATWDVPLGPRRTLEALAGLQRPRKMLVHINNTNPILLEDSAERGRSSRAGVEVAYDGLEIDLVTERATTPTRQDGPWPAAEFTARLRAQGTRYHDLHPFHRRMDAGELTREELQRWVANRYYYQKCIPLKDAAIVANCPEVEVRREWIQRIIDHDGTSDGTGGIDSWLRLGEALGVAGRLVSEQRPPRGALRGRRLRELRAPQAVVRGDRIIAHRALRTGRDPGAARGVRASLRLDQARELEYFRTRLVKAPPDAQYALDLTVERCRTRGQQQAAVAALRFKTEMLWAQLDAIERGDTQPPVPGA